MHSSLQFSGVCSGYMQLVYTVNRFNIHEAKDVSIAANVLCTKFALALVMKRRSIFVPCVHFVMVANLLKNDFQMKTN